MNDFLIVGAGLTGATIARILTDAGASVRVVEKRRHVAGNCYDELVEGILVNRYGGHIFHTNSDRIWGFVRRFSDWTPYEHRVKAFYRGKMYTLPPNRMTVQQLGANGNAAQAIRETLFAGYSFKQWGRKLDDLPRGVLARIPIRDNWDDRYYDDRHQAMPAEGYTKFVERMLWGVPVDLGVDYIEEQHQLGKTARRVVYTGPLDAMFDYCFGPLEYRSLRFETVHTTKDYQGCATVNYTDYEPAYTRVLEWKYFGHRHKGVSHSIISFEFPEAEGEPYYPVNTPENTNIYALYKQLADRYGLTVAGRLGRYQYLDMDQAIGGAMRVAEGLINGN